MVDIYYRRMDTITDLNRKEKSVATVIPTIHGVLSMTSA
jgi:hypothetical protein